MSNAKIVSQLNTTKAIECSSRPLYIHCLVYRGPSLQQDWVALLCPPPSGGGRCHKVFEILPAVGIKEVHPVVPRHLFRCRKTAAREVVAYNTLPEVQEFHAIMNSIYRDYCLRTLNGEPPWPRCLLYFWSNGH